MMLKCVMMSPRNVAYTPLANLDNPKIAEHIYTHTHTHTHTRTRAFSPTFPSA
jgi:hypothetical protein